MRRKKAVAELLFAILDVRDGSRKGRGGGGEGKGRLNAEDKRWREV